MLVKCTWGEMLKKSNDYLTITEFVQTGKVKTYYREVINVPKKGKKKKGKKTKEVSY